MSLLFLEKIVLDDFSYPRLLTRPQYVYFPRSLTKPLTTVVFLFVYTSGTPSSLVRTISLTFFRTN